MSATDPDGERRHDRPEIELQHRFDDRSDPSELTVFSPQPRNLATEWLTVDRASAVPLDEIR